MKVPQGAGHLGRIRLLNQLRQRPQAVRVVDGDVVRDSLENAVVLEATKGARQDLGSLRSLGMTASF